MNLLLAQVDTDYRWVAGIVLAVIYVVGHIASALKKKPDGTAPPPRGRVERPRAPVPPRPPRREEQIDVVLLPPEPPRPQPTPRRPEPPVRRPEPAQARPQRPASRAPARPQRPAPTQRPPVVHREPEHSVPAAAIAPIAHFEHAPFPSAHHELHEISEGRAAAGQAPAASRSNLSTNVLRVLKSRSGLAGALVLAEILAPPVSLRDNHLT